jgi:hypothetical protein
LVGDGHFNAAIKVLQAVILAPDTPETVKAVLILSPEGPAIPSVEVEAPCICLQVGKDEFWRLWGDSRCKRPRVVMGTVFVTCWML